MRRLWSQILPWPFLVCAAGVALLLCARLSNIPQSIEVAWLLESIGYLWALKALLRGAYWFWRKRDDTKEDGGHA